MKLIQWLTLVGLFCTVVTAYAVGVEEVVVPDPNDKPLAARIWFPDVSDQSNAVKGDRLPLIVISHGTGGSRDGHEGTALALANAGFVVIAITHTGDNYRDLSYVGQGKQLIERPRHIARTIDYMLTAWRAHKQLDPERIGVFGFSAGGFTALVLAGGQPDLTRTTFYCRENPNAWSCNYLRKNGVSLEQIKTPSATSWVHDARVKAIAIAAPAIHYSFEPQGLANVNVPIQLWGAESDAIVHDSAEKIRQLLPQSPEYHRVPGAGHFSFMSPCDRARKAIITVLTWFGTEAICDDPRGFDRQQFHATFNNRVTQFFMDKLH